MDLVDGQARVRGTDLGVDWHAWSTSPSHGVPPGEELVLEAQNRRPRVASISDLEYTWRSREGGSGTCAVRLIGRLRVDDAGAIIGPDAGEWLAPWAGWLKGIPRRRWSDLAARTTKGSCSPRRPLDHLVRFVMMLPSFYLS